MSSTKTISKVPEITPELLEKNDQEQAKWRKMYELRPQSPRSYAETVIKTNLDALDSLERQLKAAKRAEKPALKAAIARIRDDSAIWASSIGMFSLAAELTTSKHERKEHRDRHKAIHRHDDDWCKHPRFYHVDGELHQLAYREMDFFSPKHMKTVSMIRCNECGFRNARDLHTELKKLSDHRAESVAKHAKDEQPEVKSIKEIIS